MPIRRPPDGRVRTALLISILALATAATAGVLLLRAGRTPHAAASLASAERRAQQGDYPAAAAAYEQALSAEPEAARARFGLAIARFHMGDTARALQSYAEGLRSDPQLFETDDLESVRRLFDDSPTAKAVLQSGVLGAPMPPELPKDARAAALDLCGRIELDRCRQVSRAVASRWQARRRSEPGELIPFLPLPQYRPQDLGRLVSYAVEHEDLAAPDTQSLLLLALRAEASGRRARTLLEAALSENAAFAPSALILAEMDEADGRIEEALARYAALAEEDRLGGAGRLAALRLGAIRLERGQFSEARALCERVLVSFPSDLEAHLTLLVIRSRTGQPASALLDAQRLAQQQRYEPRVQNTLGLLLAQAGLFDQASAALQDTAASRDDWADGHFNLALSHHHQDNDEQALGELKRAVALRPDHLAAQRALAALLLERQLYEAAAHQAAELLACYPDQPDGLLLLGVALAYDGKPDDALRAFAPLSADTWQGRLAAWYRTALLLTSGQEDRLLAELERSLGERPDDPFLLARLGFARLATRQFDPAASAFERAVRLNPQDLTSRLYLAHLALLRGSRGEAENALLYSLAAGADPGTLRAFFLALGRRDWPTPMLLSSAPPPASRPPGPAPAEVFFSLFREQRPDELLKQMLALDLSDATAAATLAALRQQATPERDVFALCDWAASHSVALHAQLLDAAEHYLVEIAAAAPARLAHTDAWWDGQLLRLMPP